jgi:hypothetical protein
VGHDATTFPGTRYVCSGYGYCGDGRVLRRAFWNDGPLHLWGGLLAKTSDQYLDGSGRAFQQGYLGNGTRAWGETYGVKVGRFYMSLSVKHVNPRVTPKQAAEE